MYKIIYGIPAITVGGREKLELNDKGHIEDYKVGNEPDIWCDFELGYYPEEDYYKFEFETMLGWDNDSGCRNWIVYCLSCLTEYMIKNNLDITKELNMYSVFTEGVDVTSQFRTIEDAYAWLKMMVFGFHGTALDSK